jgi:uncharacterized protein
MNGEDLAFGASENDRTWGTLSHGLALAAGLFTGMAFVPPLIIYIVYREKSPYIRHHASESLNFQISFLMYVAVSALLILVLIGFVLLLMLAILWLVVVISATVKTSRGEMYRYPLTIRLFS